MRRREELDRPIQDMRRNKVTSTETFCFDPKEKLLGLIVKAMAVKYKGTRDKLNKCDYKFETAGGDLETYDPQVQRYFVDESYEIMYHLWKCYVRDRYGKEMNSLGMSAVMQNQIRKAFRNNELTPLLKPSSKAHQGIVENIVCKFIEVTLEYYGIENYKTVKLDDSSQSVGFKEITRRAIGG